MRSQRRRFLMHAFEQMGLPCFEPFGAFYVFPCIREFGMTSEEFATRLLEQERVAVVPGNAFGDSLKEAMTRLGRFVGSLRRS